MASIGDPADGQFNPPPKSKVDQLIEIFTQPGWEYASNMKSGDPRILVDEILRLRRLIADEYHNWISSSEYIEVALAELTRRSDQART